MHSCLSLLEETLINPQIARKQPKGYYFTKTLTRNFNIPANDWTVARRKCLVLITKYDFSYARHWHVSVDITIVRVSCDANHRTRVSVDKHHRATIGWFTRRVFARCFPRNPHDDHRAMHHRPSVSKFLAFQPFGDDLKFIPLMIHMLGYTYPSYEYWFRD